MKIATVECPHCKRKQEVDIWDDSCLGSMKCSHCKQTIKAEPEEGKCTCVICAYSKSVCGAGE